MFELGAISGSKDAAIHACTELACARGRGQEREKMAAQSRGPASRHASEWFWQPRTAFCLFFSRPLQGLAQSERLYQKARGVTSSVKLSVPSLASSQRGLSNIAPRSAPASQRASPRGPSASADKLKQHVKVSDTPPAVFYALAVA